MDKKQIEMLTEKIRLAGTILIFGHKNPDGDSLGAALGLQHLIRAHFNKTADVAYDGNLPITLDFLPGRADVWYAEKLCDKKYDLFISVDMGSTQQFGDFGKKLFDAANDSVRIDHHKTADWNANLEFVDVNASSACEIIYDIATAANLKIGTDCAICLCAGIYTDTGGFAFIDGDNNKPLLVAADLVTRGADMREITEGLKNHTCASVMAEADVLARAEFFYNGKLAVASVPHSHYKKLDSGSVSIIMNLRSIRGTEVVVVLKEARRDEVGLSIRSRRTPVRQIAEKFGGGGHDFSAGGKIPATLTEAKKIIVAEFKGIL